MNQSLTERVTRLLAFMLRHQPEQFDLEVDAFGFADVEDVLDALSERVDEDLELEDLEQAIDAGDRPRYEISSGRIRALYGHSIAVEPGEPAQPPEFLYVGLPAREAERAEEYGLRSGRRRFLHLALTPEDAMETGRRSAVEYSVITIDALDAWEDGINFYDRKSLFLAEEIPTQFLEVGPTHTDGTAPGERGGRGERSGRGERGGRSERGGRGGRRGRDDDRGRGRGPRRRGGRDEQDDRPRRSARDDDRGEREAREPVRAGGGREDGDRAPREDSSGGGRRGRGGRSRGDRDSGPRERREPRGGEGGRERSRRPQRESRESEVSESRSSSATGTMEPADTAGSGFGKGVDAEESTRREPRRERARAQERAPERRTERERPKAPERPSTPEPAPIEDSEPPRKDPPPAFGAGI